ncbi:MAG TPA: DHH family phosphoesterase, partial [Candidatus Bipolaricaulota bacterium]
MKRWIEPDPAEVPAEFLEKIGGHPLVAHTLWRRGMTDPAQALAFLDPRVYRPASAWELPGMEQAVERLFKALKVREKICVWGDFDVDGQTSTTLLVSTLQELGADVFFHIPLRDTESHGIKLPALRHVLGQGAQLVLTCDTGIGEHEPIIYAQSQGVDVIVTDHHALPAELPQAHALINPQMLPPQHPLRTLPGVGVAYKLAEALYERAGRPGEAEKNLDLVALGIVADVAVQRGDTRYLLQRGLEALRRTQRVGLQALMEVADLDP